MDTVKRWVFRALAVWSIASLLIIAFLAAVIVMGDDGDGASEEVAGLVVTPTPSPDGQPFATSAVPAVTATPTPDEELLSAVETVRAGVTATVRAYALQTVAAGPYRTPQPESTPGHAGIAEPDSYDLALISAGCAYTVEGGVTKCEGLVKNISDGPLEHVVARAVLHAADGAAVSPGGALIENDPLAPGERSTFRIIATDVPAFTDWQIEFSELLGDPIPARDDRPDE